MKEQNQTSEAAILNAAIECIEFIRSEGLFRLVRDSEVAAIIKRNLIDAATAEVKKEGSKKDSGFADNTDAVHSKSPEQTGLTFRALRVANVARYKDYPCDDWTLTDWGCCIAGEVGETCNLLKKLKLGKEIDKAEIAKEIADIVIYCDILSEKLGFDLGQITRAKFNEVSARIGSQVLLGSEVPTQKAPTDTRRTKENAPCLAAPSRKQDEVIEIDEEGRVVSGHELLASLQPSTNEEGLAARVEPTKAERWSLKPRGIGSNVDIYTTFTDKRIIHDVPHTIASILKDAHNASCAVKEEKRS